MDVSRLEKQIRRKIKQIRNAEWGYWSRFNSTVQQIDGVREFLGSRGLELPLLGSTIHGFVDGCVLVRHARVNSALDVEIAIHCEPFNNWRELAYMPSPEGPVLFGKFISLPGATFINCAWTFTKSNTCIKIPYLSYHLVEYEKTDTELEEVLFDLRLAFQSIAGCKAWCRPSLMNRAKM